MTAAASTSTRAAAPGAAPLPALGAILAGGASRRFGAVKALATVGGVPIVMRARAAVAAAVTHPVVITQLAEIARVTGLSFRPDVTRVGGPLAGVDTALRWATELGLAGALCVACDLPFLPAGLLREIVAEGLENEALAVVPESDAAIGFEPLCAWYSTRALAQVQRALEREERRVTSLLEEVGAARISLARVAEHGDPAVIFLNVNTPDGHREAERIAARGGSTA